jgi:hypothetical protein
MLQPWTLRLILATDSVPHFAQNRPVSCAPQLTQNTIDFTSCLSLLYLPSVPGVDRKAV